MPSPESLQQRLAWVPLPAGLSDDGSEALFSVHLSMALTFDDVGAAATLADFPDLLDWPTTLGSVQMRIAFGEGGSTEARLLPGDRSSDVWRRLFPPATRIEPFAGNQMASRPVVTFSSRTVLESLRRSYVRTVLDAVDDLPLIAPLMAGLVADEMPFSDVAQAMGSDDGPALMAADDQTFAHHFTSMLASAQETAAAAPESMAEVIPPTGEAGGEFARAMAFHRGPPPADGPMRDTPGALDAVRAAMELHRTMTCLAEQPAVLRALGLVFDVAIPVADLGEGPNGSIRFDAELLSAMPVFALPPDSPFFEGPTVMRQPWLGWRLEPGAVLPFRVDSAAPQGLVDISSSSDHLVEQVALDSAVLQAVSMVSSLPAEGRRQPPPALRSGGLALLKDGRARALHADFVAADQGERGTDLGAPLLAEEVTRGYRLDVLDEERATWFTLHARTVDYLHEGTPLLAPVADEGAFAPSVTGPEVAPGTDPPPGSPVYLNESTVRWDGWSLSAPRPEKSLAVDPAPDPARPETMPQHVANDPHTDSGLQVEARVRPGTLPRLRFGRRYRLRVRTVDLAGNGLSSEQADDLWRRPSIADGEEGARLPASAFGSDSIRFSRFEPVPAPAIVTAAPTEDSSHRLVVRSGVDPDLQPLLPTDDDRLQVFAPKGSVQLAERHGKFDDVLGASDRERRRAAYDLAARESQTLPPTGADVVPYLPDPLAVGVALAGAPGVPAGITFRVGWDPPTWDSPRPILLRLVPNTLDFQQAPTWDPTSRTITIPLEPARRVVLRVASKVPEGAAFGLLDWCRADLDEQTVQQLQRAVDSSRHCMVTPWDEVELVHAVQRPLAAPDLAPGERVFRAPGATDYRFTGTLAPEPLSTGSLTLTARWEEWLDDPAVEMHPTAQDPRPWVRPAASVVGSTALTEPAFVDGVVAVTPRTGLYFPGSAMPDLQLSDTKHRVVTFTVTGTSRFADHFPGPPVAEPERFTRTGAGVEDFVESTARPPVPVVVDVVPVLPRVVSPDGSTRTREGGWVRVRLERPWFATGAGEQLGIVIADQVPGIEDVTYELTSLLGTDLAHFSTLTEGMLTQHVANAGGGESNLVLPEIAERVLDDPPEVFVLTFDPSFDEDRQLWYADIRFDVPAAYFPVVRLAVVRCQRNSILDVPTVSPVVLTEIVPLFPERRLTVQRGADGSVILTLAGVTYSRIRTLDDTDDDSPEALATVTARAQRRTGVPFTGETEVWDTSAIFTFTRDEDAGHWTLQIPAPEVAAFGPGVERLLVVEEDHLAHDPGVSKERTHSPRVVYAEVVEGPFTT
jgi:hypothetical protein